MIEVSDDRVSDFYEKPHGDEGWINGGFFVLSSSIASYIDDDSTVWEREPMERLVAANELSAYKHTGFWQPMDTLRDKHYLEQLWNEGTAPWKVW
jgi:glucose-1-phosphate cytidylyltransferase